MVVIKHYVVNTASQSSATIRLIGHMDPWAEVCITKKVCMKTFGDGSPESFRMRNSNRRQKNCLSGAPEAGDKDKCDKLTHCLDGENAKNAGKLLKAMLKAAITGNGASLGQAESHVGEGDCVDPYSADPEAYECECMEELQAKCGSEGSDSAVEECMRVTMCENPNVCCAWKQDNCPGTSCQASSLMDRRGGGNGTDAVASRLDSATSGKCVM